MPDQDNAAPSSGGGLTDAHELALIGTIITVGAGVFDTVARVEGNRAVGTSGQNYDLSTLLAQQDASRRAEDDRRRREEEDRQREEDAKTDWTPWIAAGAVGVVLLVMGMNR